MKIFFIKKKYIYTCIKRWNFLIKKKKRHKMWHLPHNYKFESHKLQIEIAYIVSHDQRICYL